MTSNTLLHPFHKGQGRQKETINYSEKKRHKLVKLITKWNSTLTKIRKLYSSSSILYIWFLQSRNFLWVLHLPFSVKRLEAPPSEDSLVLVGSERCSLANAEGSVLNKWNSYLRCCWSHEAQHSTHFCSYQNSGLRTSNHFQGSQMHLQKQCRNETVIKKKLHYIQIL